MMRAAGFSLVEALVALLVVSFGLLGVGTMQLKALEGAHVGYRHSLVNLMAVDAQERVWKYLAENSGSCPVYSKKKDDSTLTPINDAWLDYWFGTANLGFTAPEYSNNSEGPITKVGIQDICQYRVLVRWEELPYSINEEERGEDPERIKEFEYFFRVPNFE